MDIPEYKVNDVIIEPVSDRIFLIIKVEEFYYIVYPIKGIVHNAENKLYHRSRAIINSFLL